MAAINQLSPKTFAKHRSSGASTKTETVAEPRKLRTLDEYMIGELSDPSYAAVYLQVILEEYQSDNDFLPVLDGLRLVAKAQGGIALLAEKTGLSRESLYKTLSHKGNPRLDTLVTILGGLGYRLSVEPMSPDVQAAKGVPAAPSEAPQS